MDLLNALVAAKKKGRFKSDGITNMPFLQFTEAAQTILKWMCSCEKLFFKKKLVVAKTFTFFFDFFFFFYWLRSLSEFLKYLYSLTFRDDGDTCLLGPYLHTNIVQIDKPVKPILHAVAMLAVQFYDRKENLQQWTFFELV